MMIAEDVWVTTSYQNVAARLAAEGIEVPYCQLDAYTNGGAGHPWADGHVAAAQVLAEFIKTHVLNG